MEILDLALWTAGAVIVVGIMQWAKNILPKVPPKAWAFILPVVSFGAAVAGAVKGNDFSGILWNGAGIWAVAQVGYELIVQSIKKKLGGS